MVEWRSVRVWGASLLLAASLTGCSGEPEQVHSALQESRSAVQSARLAVRLADDERSTRGVAVTALTDALSEITSAGTTLAQLDNAREARDRRSALRLIRRAGDVVSTARDEAGEGRVSSRTRSGLAAAARAIDAELDRQDEG